MLKTTYLFQYSCCDLVGFPRLSLSCPVLTFNVKKDFIFFVLLSILQSRGLSGSTPRAFQLEPARVLQAPFFSFPCHGALVILTSVWQSSLSTWWILTQYVGSEQCHSNRQREKKGWPNGTLYIFDKKINTTARIHQINGWLNLGRHQLAQGQAVSSTINSCQCSLKLSTNEKLKMSHRRLHENLPTEFSLNLWEKQKWSYCNSNKCLFQDIILSWMFPFLNSLCVAVKKKHPAASELVTRSRHKAQGEKREAAGVKYSGNRMK